MEQGEFFYDKEDIDNVRRIGFKYGMIAGVPTGIVICFIAMLVLGEYFGIQ